MSPSKVRVAATLSRRSRLFSLLTLHRTRGVLRNRWGKALAVSIAIVYGFLALLAGFMLQIVPTGASGTTVRVLTNSYSPAWWNYPAVLVVTPGGIIVLPFLSTISMVLVSIGVGAGMGAGILLAFQFFRTWKAARAGREYASPLAGLTPAMVALLTLGACCSTSAAAAGSIGAIAEVSGTSYDQVLLNSWILNVFQVAILGIALLAQEYLIGVFSNLAKPSSVPKPFAPAGGPAPSLPPLEEPTGPIGVNGSFDP